MKSACGLLLALVAAAAVAAADAQETGGINWRRDYNAARQESRERGLPLFILCNDAYEPWCQEFEKTTLRNPRLAALINKNTIPTYLPPAKNAKLAEALNVKAFPTTLLARPSGEIVDSFEGFRDVKQTEEMLAKVLKR